MKGVLTGSVDPSTVLFSAIESLAADVCESWMSIEPLTLFGLSV